MAALPQARCPTQVEAISGLASASGAKCTGGGHEGGDPDAHCQVERLCPIRGGWEKVNDAIRGALEAVSLSDLIYTNFEDLPPLKTEIPAEVRGQI